MWWPFKSAAVPPADEMDWQPSTPPQSPQIYRGNYVPGGWPEALPTPKFARGPDPDDFLPRAKRVCRGLGRAGALTANTTATVGVGVATVGANSLAFTAKFTATSTISIIRKLRQRRPREPNPRSRTGQLYEPTHGYSTPLFLNICTDKNPVSLAQETENKNRIPSMTDLARWRTRQPPPPRMSKPWIDTYKGNSLVTMPFENPRESIEENMKAKKNGNASPVQPVFYPNQRQKKSSTAYEIYLRKMRQKYMHSQLVSVKSPRKAQDAHEQPQSTPDASMIDDTIITEDTVITDHGASPTQNHTIAETNVNVETPNRAAELPFLSSPATSSSSPSVRSDTTPRSPLEADGSPLLETPSRITGQSSLLETPELPPIPETPGTWMSDRAENVDLHNPETPSCPGTPSSDISSTCDFTPEPIYGMFVVPSAADAVDLYPSSPPQVAQKAPPSRISPSVVGKITGRRDDEITVDDMDEESGPPETDQTARRTRSMQLRIKEEEPRSPQTKKTQIQTPAKTPKHGKTKKEVAVEVQEKRALLRRGAEKWKITGLSDRQLEIVEQAVKHGDARTNLKAYDFSRVAPFRKSGGSRENWLNDETINEYLKVVAAHGEEHKGRQDGKKAHHAFNSFFYSNLINPDKGPKFLRRWSKRAAIGGKSLLDTRLVFIPINSGAHWTLCAVSGVDKTITYYDSMNGDGRRKMQEILEWVEAELESDFKRDEWLLRHGTSGQQANCDDCGVFAVTNARSLVLGEEPEKAFGPEKVRIQRERIVAEIVHGALLARGE